MTSQIRASTRLRGRPALMRLAILAAAAAGLLAGMPGAAAQQDGGRNSAQRIEQLVSGVVRIRTHINPQGATVQGLGREREGSGILIDHDGLVLTIGYLMVEAYAAEVTDNYGHTVPANVVGYDHETGFGLLRSMAPSKLEPTPRPMPLGRSGQLKEHDPVLIASFGGTAMVSAAYVLA